MGVVVPIFGNDALHSFLLLEKNLANFFTQDFGLHFYVKFSQHN